MGTWLAGARAMRSAMRVLAVGLLGGIVHCSPAGDEPLTAGDAHTAKELVWNNDVFQWASTTREEFELVNPRQPEVFPADDPATRRLQEWANRLHEAAKAMVLEQTGQALAAPPPMIRIAHGGAPNGWVSPIPACLEPTRPDPARPVVELARGWLMPQATCLVPSNWPVGAAEWFDNLGICRLGNASTPASGAPCDRVGVQAPAIRAVSPFVHIAAGSVKKLSEATVVATIAHELGHYYRAHSSTGHTHQYEFWFDREHHEPRRPVPAPDQEEMSVVYAWAAGPKAIIAGQRLHPGLVRSAVLWGEPLAHTEVCKEAGDALQNLPSSIVTAIMTGGRIVDGAAYLAAEAKLMDCAQDLALDQTIAESLGWPLPGNLFDSLFSSATLGEALTVMTAQAAELDQRAAAVTERLERNQIGLYTREQEADDIALELSARVGITPGQVIDGTFEKMRVREAEDVEAFPGLNNGMTTEQCRALYLQDFPTYVPIGDPSNLHHAYCYRAFNMAREAASHHYEVAPELPELAPSWAELQASVPDE